MTPESGQDCEPSFMLQYAQVFFEVMLYPRVLDRLFRVDSLFWILHQHDVNEAKAFLGEISLCLVKYVSNDGAFLDLLNDHVVVTAVVGRLTR